MLDNNEEFLFLSSLFIRLKDICLFFCIRGLVNNVNCYF